MRPEGLGKFKNWVSNPRLSGLWLSASTTTLPHARYYKQQRAKQSWCVQQNQTVLKRSSSIFLLSLVTDDDDCT
jgi:hypothetical protein